MYYLPIESYPERYTMQLSARETGWMEKAWTGAGVEYTRIDGPTAYLEMSGKAIRSGAVVDTYGRYCQASCQIRALVKMAQVGEFTDRDVIYAEDFWTPGIEALAYALHFCPPEKRPKVFAYCWAQSVDEYDFTAKMGTWMRAFEVGIADFLTGIFVATPLLKDLLCHPVDGIVTDPKKVHVVGLPFDSEEVMSRMPGWWRKRESLRKLPHRLDRVIWSSRWDTEKNPDFFLAVVEEVLKRRPSTEFVVCTSAPTLRSNDPKLLGLLQRIVDRYPDNLKLLVGLSKERYYAELCKAKVQFNCASQDWWSFTLLESSVAGCFPVYPRFRSFPETFLASGQSSPFLYDFNPNNKAACVEYASTAICDVLMKQDLWTVEECQKRAWVHKRCDSTWSRMTNVMGITEIPVKDPFDATQW